MVFHKNKEPRISPGLGRLLHQFFEDDCAGEQFSQELFVLVPLKYTLDFFGKLFFGAVHHFSLFTSHHIFLSAVARQGYVLR